ncbi:HNH endonuclease [Furfurilactobacillus milii]|uniref:HNH endonuclease n=1 Tax=Furfurilactobacillus rossiae TaxID=231049 RepID=A0A7C9IXR7_9LACO|nr:HNH endonuclease [Furfurilactobacillus milii]MYV04438.1 HNH endonuclease [Furfurilactobacillus milii]
MNADKYHQYMRDTESQLKQSAAGRKQLANRAKHYDDTKRPEYEQLSNGSIFYHSQQWKTVSRFVKTRDMYCSAITGTVLKDTDVIVDHIVPMRLMDSQHKLDADNLWLLSRAQHNRKTHIEQSMSDNQLKHLPKAWWIKVLKEREH